MNRSIKPNILGPLNPAKHKGAPVLDRWTAGPANSPPSPQIKKCSKGALNWGSENVVLSFAFSRIFIKI